MQKITKILFLFCALCFLKIDAQTSYLDSVELTIKGLNTKQQIEALLALPYDKIVGNTTKSEQLFLKALSGAKTIQNKELEADIYTKLALLNYFHGNFDKKLDYDLKAIKIYESINKMDKAGANYAGLGFAMKRRDIDKAKAYMQKGISELEKANDLVTLNAVYDNYGTVQEMDGNLDSAIYFFYKALSLKREQNDSIGIPFALTHISSVYVQQKKYEEAKDLIEESLSIRTKRNDIYGIAESMVFYAEFYYAQENYQKALKWFSDCYKTALKNNYIHLAQYAADYTSICYQKLGNYQQAFFYQQAQQNLKDSLLNESTNKTIAELETQFETQKKEKQIANQKEELAKQQLKLKQRNYTLASIVGLVLFFIILSFLIYRRQKFKQQKLIEANKLKDEIASIELRNKLQEERLRISRDLHDNIGAQLTFIISSIDNISYFIKDSNYNLKNKLNELNEFSRTAISELRNTIKILNNTNTNEKNN